MKRLILLYILLGYFTANAQIEPLLEHTWELQQVVTADSTLTVPSDMVIVLEVLDAGNDSFEVYFGSCQDLTALGAFDDQNQSFVISEILIPLGDCNIDEILSYEYFLYEEFLFEDPNLSIPHQPYSYAFTTESNIIYLDITNSIGGVATYTASTLSNDNFEAIQISIYPNPTTNLLHIDSKETIIESIEIYQLNGKQVLKSDFFTNQLLDVSHLNKGVYLMKIQTEKGSVTKKMVKK